jgi:cell division septum initiation protein DivIVA
MWVEADVTDGPDVPGEWDPSGQAEPPAALLRRAISHVEQLLQRLERPGAPVENAIDPTAGSVGTGMGSTVEATPADDSGAIEPVLNNPVRRISSAAQAEALRVSLNAHEKANRLLAEASAIRAQSASEGEQILVEARELADRMQGEASEEAALYVSRAREDAESLVSQAAAEMDRVREAALEESDRLRSEAMAEAERVRASALEESDRLRREARDEADAMRSNASAEGAQARETAQAEADALVAEAERLRDSVQQEADRLLTASSEEAQRLREAAERDAERMRSDAEQQARVDREAADAAIREVLDQATVDAEPIRAQAREQGQVEAAQLVEAQVQDAVAAARTELDAEKVRVYEMLGYANDSVAEVRASMRELIEALGRSMGTVNGATGSLGALMGRLRDVANDNGVQIQGPPVEPAAEHDLPREHAGGADEPSDAARAEAVEVADDSGYDHGSSYADSGEVADDADEAEGGDDSRRPLGLLFGASHKSRASKR